jgi:transposase
VQLDINNLPTDTALLHQLVRDMAAVVERRDGEIERLRLIIKKLQREQFGRRSERADDQLELGLEDSEADLAQAEEPALDETPPDSERGKKRPKREPLPSHARRY